MVHVPDAGLLALVTDGAARLRDEALGLGLSADRLRIVGERDFGAARDGLAACGVAAVPRRACPGFPMKVLNALGLGIPVVACIGAAPDLPGVLRVPPGEPRRLGEGLRRWISDPVAAKAAGGLGQDKVRGEWSWARRAFQWEQLVAGFRTDPAPG
jgi:glycosyltransferase involved in cell wall biosynthesis